MVGITTSKRIMSFTHSFLSNDFTSIFIFHFLFFIFFVLFFLNNTYLFSLLLFIAFLVIKFVSSLTSPFIHLYFFILFFFSSCFFLACFPHLPTLVYISSIYPFTVFHCHSSIFHLFFCPFSLLSHHSSLSIPYPFPALSHSLLLSSSLSLPPTLSFLCPSFLLSLTLTLSNPVLHRGVHDTLCGVHGPHRPVRVDVPPLGGRTPRWAHTAHAVHSHPHSAFTLLVHTVHSRYTHSHSLFILNIPRFNTYTFALFHNLRIR